MSVILSDEQFASLTNAINMAFKEKGMEAMNVSVETINITINNDRNTEELAKKIVKNLNKKRVTF